MLDVQLVKILKDKLVNNLPLRKSVDEIAEVQAEAVLAYLGHGTEGPRIEELQRVARRIHELGTQALFFGQADEAAYAYQLGQLAGLLEAPQPWGDGPIHMQPRSQKQYKESIEKAKPKK